MNTLAVRRSQAGGKPPPIRRELVEESWDDFVKARAKVCTSDSFKERDRHFWVDGLR